MIVEPDGLVRRGLRELLSENGYEVEAHRSADPALKALAESRVRPALLIAAIALDTLDGASLGRAFRARWPRVPVLLIVPQGFAASAAWRSLPPGTFLLEKPINDEVLELLLRRFAAPAAGREPHISASRDRAL